MLGVFGRCVSGEFNTEEMAVYSDFFIGMGYKLTNQSFADTDSFSRAIEDGLVSDVSVGFYGYEERCNICESELWSGSCRHWPGLKYEIEKGEKKETVVATTTIYNAHLSEYSLVYDGALEGAVIVEKAKRTQDRLNTREREHITKHFGVDFDKIPIIKTHSIPDVKPKVNNDRRNNKMSILTNEEQITQLQSDKELLLERAQKAEEAAKDIFLVRSENELLERRVKEAEVRAETAKKLVDSQKEQLAKLDKKVEELTPKAKSFETFKVQVIDEKMKLRVAIWGDEDADPVGYKEDKEVLESLPSIERIEKHASTWQRIVDEKYPGGSQLEEEEEEKENNKEPQVPNMEAHIDAF